MNKTQQNSDFTQDKFHIQQIPQRNINIQIC